MPETAQYLQERRRHPRTQLQMKMQCIRLDPDGGDVVEVLDTVNISRSGLGAMCERPFYPGQRVVLCMPLTTISGQRNIYTTVVRCRRKEQGYSIGMEFDTASVSLWGSQDHAFAAA